MTRNNAWVVMALGITSVSMGPTRAEAQASESSAPAAQAAPAAEAAPAPVEPAARQPVASGAATQTLGVSADTEKPPILPRRTHRQKRSFVPMVVGLGVFAGSYLFSVAVGAELLARDTDTTTLCLNCRYGSKLFVPVVGPWLLYPKADGSAGKALTAVMGVLQGAGLVLSIWGIARFVSTGSSDLSEGRADRFALAVMPLPSGAYGTARLSF